MGTTVDPRWLLGSIQVTREQWFRLPLPLRQRWWQETNYGRKPPTADLEREILSTIAGPAFTDLAESDKMAPHSRIRP
jgi:hypothetical protein